MKSKGESQRIYWQQWLSGNSKNNGVHHSRRELITSSAAIRINPDAAKARDVTQLLRDTLKISALETEEAQQKQHSDYLVLVGTLYSLPQDYIQFEHEPPPPQNKDSPKLPMPSSEPFHVIKTLQPDDNPLTIRDQMMDHLRRIQEHAPASRSTIAPKVQWYFVPRYADPTKSPIPSCVELDGYSTSMEEEGEDSENEDSESVAAPRSRDSADETDTKEIHGNVYDPDLLMSRLSQLEQVSDGADASTVLRTALEQKKLEQRNKELRRFTRMSQEKTCCSGYLLKQSNVDPHVWRRVYCVLTDEHLWYTTRVPYSSTTPTTSSPPRILERVAKRHGMVTLNRALLLEPNSDCPKSPLYRIPNSFEIVSPRGTSHIFRAPNRAYQRQWIQATSMKIVESFENSLMGHAELIVADESTARTNRFASVAVDPLNRHTVETPEDTPATLTSVRKSVLRMGLDIAEYREECRHVQALLPAKQPVVVRSETSPRNSSTGSPSNQANFGAAEPEPLDSSTLSRVQATWDVAAKLLDQATQVALVVQQVSHAPHPKQNSLSRSLETLCRHVDYVITGQHRPLALENGEVGNGGPKATSNGGGRHGINDPPPMDLFDLLLAELQSLVASTSAPTEDLGE